MHAYILITVGSGKEDEVFDAIDPLVTLAEGTSRGWDWDITAHIHKTKKADIIKIHRKIRKINGVIETALAFEMPTSQKKKVA